MSKELKTWVNMNLIYHDLNDGCLSNGEKQDKQDEIQTLREIVFFLEEKISNYKSKMADREKQLEKLFDLLTAYEQRLTLLSDEVKVKSLDIDLLVSIIENIKRAKDAEEIKLIVDNFDIHSSEINYIH